MPNEKAGAALLLTNVHNKSRLFFVFLFGFICFSCARISPDNTDNSDMERQIIENGNTCIENGNYQRAKEIYYQFIIKYPDHPYIDDAEYRLAYIAVIADDKNPYFNYDNAEILFQNFIENYPNSHYIIACNNWLKLLSKVSEKSRAEESVASEDDTLSKEINQLKNQLSALQRENTQLKKTLEDLQRAIER